VKAMILAAGLGTRLKPYTDHSPKALVKMNGKPLLEIIINRLTQFGIDEIIINAHHFKEQIVEYVKHYSSSTKLYVSVENEILDTGGGLMNAASFFDDKPFLLHNVDILTDLNYRKMLAYHKKHQPLATLFVRNRTTSRYLLFNAQNELRGWQNIKTGEKKLTNATKTLSKMAFSGVHIISPNIFKNISERGNFSIINAYLNLSAKGYKILAYPNNSCNWLDVGKPAQLQQAEKLALSL
jgi:NDP-sugar pyrophosphorylase family protein